MRGAPERGKSSSPASFVSGPSVKREIEAGATFDVALSIVPVIDVLIAEGKLASRTRIDVASTGVGLGVRVGAARPDIATLDGFKATLVRANAIAFPPQAQPGRTRICSRAQGCPKRCAQSSSSCPTKFLPTPCPTVRRTIPYVPQFGAELLGPLPAEVQIRIGFAAARGSSATEVQAAEALLAYLHTPEAVAVLKAKGFEPK